MLKCKPIPMQIESNTKICAYKGRDLEDITMYRQLVGSLSYLALTKPDISSTDSVMIDTCKI